MSGEGREQGKKVGERWADISSGCVICLVNRKDNSNIGKHLSQQPIYLRMKVFIT